MSAILAPAFTLACLIFVLGLGLKILRYARTPAPLKIPTTPAPTTRLGLFARMLREVVLFESLFKASLWTWFFGWLFHASLAIVLFAHLRYFTEPMWAPVLWVQGISRYAGYAMVVGLAGLWARRFLVDRIRYISAPSDHLMLALLIAIAVTGLAMRFIDFPNLVALKAFTLGLLRLDWQELPLNVALLAHLAPVVVLIAVFPFSKLLHVPGVFFSPTRNQLDNPRERRHLSRWAARLESDRD